MPDLTYYAPVYQDQSRKAVVTLRTDSTIPTFQIVLEYYGATEDSTWTFPVAVTANELGAIVQAALDALAAARKGQT